MNQNNSGSPGFNPYQMILDRMDEHKEASGARHQALYDGLRHTNQKLDEIFTELSGGNVRFERIEARIEALTIRTAAIEEAATAVKNNVLEIIKGIVVPVLLSALSAAAGAYVTWAKIGSPTAVVEHAP